MSLAAIILAIAPDTAFGASLGFVLEAEGCQVLLLKALPPANVSIDGYDCIVIDDNALTNKKKNLNRLLKSKRPVVLLADSSEDFSITEKIWIVEKPILGVALIEAVRKALAQSADLHGQFTLRRIP